MHHPCHPPRPNGAGKTSLLHTAAGEPLALINGQYDRAEPTTVFHFRQVRADARVPMRLCVYATHGFAYGHVYD